MDGTGPSWSTWPRVSPEPGTGWPDPDYDIDDPWPENEYEDDYADSAEHDHDYTGHNPDYTGEFKQITVQIYSHEGVLGLDWSEKKLDILAWG